MAMIHQVRTPPVQQRGQTHTGRTDGRRDGSGGVCGGGGGGDSICRFAPLKLIPDNDDGEVLSLLLFLLRGGGGAIVVVGDDGAEGGGKEGSAAGYKWIVHCHVPPINGQRDSRIRQGEGKEGGREVGREDGFSATPVRHLFGPDGEGHSVSQSISQPR